jgi:microtubule-associated protein, RP/EB family
VKNVVQRTRSGSNPGVEPRNTANPTKSSSLTTTVAPALIPMVSSEENTAALSQAIQTVSHLQGEIERLQGVNDELQTEMNGIEKERDFYFDKLRDIEMMLQDLEDNGGKGRCQSFPKTLFFFQLDILSLDLTSSSSFRF